MFNGLLLKESLSDERVLNLIKIIKTEIWHPKNATDFQPKTWTAIYFQGEENKVDQLVDKFSKTLKARWYLNIKVGDTIYVIYPKKVFKYPSGNKLKRVEAIIYGQKEGIPDSQLDWNE